MASCQLYLIDGSVEAAGNGNDLIISWPPRAPDLSPMDFFWDSSKEKFISGSMRKWKI